MAQLQTLFQLKAPPQADLSRPWTADHARALELVHRYEAAIQRYRPRFRLGAFLRRLSDGRQIDPRDVMMFKSCFRHLDRRAQEVGGSAEELIAAFAEHYGPLNKTDAMFHKPNLMLNREVARWLLGLWRGNVAGKSMPGEVAGRKRAQTTQATALLRERAQQSIAAGWRRLGLFLFKGRLAARFEPWWTEVESVGPEGVCAALGPVDQRIESLLTRIHRVPVARPIGPVARALLEGRAGEIPEGYRELAEAGSVVLVVEKALRGPTAILRRHRRLWWDFVVGWLLADGAGLSREFLWGVAEEIVPMPKPVVVEAREAMAAATGVAGDDYDPARRWTRSALTEWHRDAWAAELDPLLLVLAEAERTGRAVDPLAGEWAGPTDPTPLSRAYTVAQAARLRARAPRYL